MDLIINHKLINAPITDILSQLQAESGYPKIIGKEKGGTNIMISCPFHKGGEEKHPSCSVYCGNDPDILYGMFNCFACKEKGPLQKLVAHCLSISIGEAENWLTDRFANAYIYEVDYLQEINFDKPKKEYLDESILEKYKYMHPYHFQRGLNEDTIRKYKLGWNPDTDSITFPIWDEKNNLVMVTERSTKTKRFFIPPTEKPVYLLNYLIKDNVTHAYVAESQINTLLLNQWGYPAIGLIGTGSKHQYEILRKCGIRHFTLCLDGDEAGDNGIAKFITNMPKSVMIDIKQIPRGKDIADIGKEVFEQCPTLLPTIN